MSLHHFPLFVACLFCIYFERWYFCHLSWFFTDVKKGSFFVTLLSVDPSINTDMYLQLLRASTRSSLIVSPIMLANSWHLCSVWYLCLRQTPCLLSSSTIAGNLVKGISSLEIMYATSNKRLTRSFSSDEAQATALPMACSLRFHLSFSSAVAQEKRPSRGCPISNAWQRCHFRARFL